jgi:DNA primase
MDTDNAVSITNVMSDRSAIDENNRKQVESMISDETILMNDQSVSNPSVQQSIQTDVSSASTKIAQNLQSESDAPPKQSQDQISVNEFRQKYKSKSTNEGPITDPPTSTTHTNTPRTRLSNTQIEQIKSSISIVDAIESYNLPNFVRINSHSAKACCPFHDDNNPSMSIDDNRRLYKCFACGAGGDVFNFVREYDALSTGKKEKMGFMDAVRYCVGEFGGGSLAELVDVASEGWNDTVSEESRAKIIERERKKDR